MQTVEIYTTPICHFCHLAKDFFKNHNIEYVEYNVASDATRRQEMIQKTGQMGVPVIIVGGIHTLVGFSESHMAELLGLNKPQAVETSTQQPIQ